MKIIHIEKINSTNLYAKENMGILEDRTIIIADEQTSGRGRLGRTWVDLGEGNVFLSFVLKPSTDFNEVYSNLTQYLSVVLSSVLEDYGLEPQIKWPNDVLINGKKVSGILSETVMQGALFKGLALGIGVNLTAEKEDLEKIEKPVTSLNIELKREIDKEEFINKLINKFFVDYDEFLEKGFKFIKHAYLKRNSFLGKQINVQLFSEQKSGIAKSITDNGELVLLDNNKELVLTIGDIL